MLRTRVSRWILAAAVLVPLGVTSPAVAATSAVDAPPSDPAPEAVTTRMVPTSASPGTAKAALAEYCDAHADYPRLNTAGARYVYAATWVDCNRSQPRIQLTTRMWKKRWFGWQDVTSNFRVVNVYNFYYANYTPSHSCTNSTTPNTFRVTAEARVWWNNGTTTYDEFIPSTVVYACG